jgi:hypothetical protein
MASLTALSMTGEGTGSPLGVLALGDGVSLGVSEADCDAAVLDASVSVAVGSSPSSLPHATVVAATRASPEMAIGIRVMRPVMDQVCLLQGAGRVTSE